MCLLFGLVGHLYYSGGSMCLVYIHIFKRSERTTNSRRSDCWRHPRFGFTRWAASFTTQDPIDAVLSLLLRGQKRPHPAPDIHANMGGFASEICNSNCNLSSQIRGRSSSAMEDQWATTSQWAMNTDPGAFDGLVLAMPPLLLLEIWEKSIRDKQT